MGTAFFPLIFFCSSHHHDVVWPKLLVVLATVSVSSCPLLAVQVFLLRQVLAGSREMCFVSCMVLISQVKFHISVVAVFCASIQSITEKDLHFFFFPFL